MDVVYPVRRGANEELRYSLRSLANLPHGVVWIIGDPPTWVDDLSVNMVPRPTMATKYLTTTSHLKAACESPDISDPFLLFNDDFFVVRPLREVEDLHRGPIADVVALYRARFGARHTGAYLAGMVQTQRLLEGLGYESPRSYELHVPITIHKGAMLEALKVAETSGIAVPHKRSIYGNVAALGGTQIDDVKVYEIEQEIPQGPFISSCDKVFKYGVGNVVRWLFPNPSPYERES